MSVGPTKVRSKYLYGSTLAHGARFIVTRRTALPRNAMGKLERQAIAQQMARVLP